MDSSNIKGLYAIADSTFNPCESLPKLAAKYLAGGCKLIQLRMKGKFSYCSSEAKRSREPRLFLDSPASGGLARKIPVWDDDVFVVAKEILKLKKSFDFTFIINDYVDVAAELKADGVHVGCNDMPVGDIRDYVGNRLLIGYSSHSYEEAVEAEKAGADYVALGAIYPTATKGHGHPVVGIETLKRVTQALKVPVVAIGGIKRENYREVFEAGASATSMITALTKANDITAETKWFIENQQA
jgi:thiamine-phosphate pyrophosphorylase